VGWQRRWGANAVNGVINIITEQMEITGPDSSVLFTRIELSGLVKLTWRF
jgi:outer membrane cobalamin receptor